MAIRGVHGRRSGGGSVSSHRVLRGIGREVRWFGGRSGHDYAVLYRTQSHQRVVASALNTRRSGNEPGAIAAEVFASLPSAPDRPRPRHGDAVAQVLVQQVQPPPTIALRRRDLNKRQCSTCLPRRDAAHFCPRRTQPLGVKVLLLCVPCAAVIYSPSPEILANPKAVWCMLPIISCTPAGYRT